MFKTELFAVIDSGDNIWNNILIRRSAMQITAQSFKDHFWKYTNDLFALLDEGGSFVKVNNAWKKQLGFSESELLETRFSDVFVDVDQHIIYNSLEDLRHKRK
ncbi:MAG: PAS domain-containing protein, partial [Calditrichia bacterium]